MATDRDFVDYVLEQSGLGSTLNCKKMFGEYAFYLDGKVVALACDNRFFVKPTDAVQVFLPELPRQPPYPGAKPYWLLDDLLDDPDILKRVLKATAGALPAPEPKTRKRIGK